jgi:flagellar biosynthesis/type III secretory pathway M-ring protein FliF/YscJ
MVTELLVIWIVAVVAFFTLWAILAKVVHKISERKKHDEDTPKDQTDETPTQEP